MRDRDTNWRLLAIAGMLLGTVLFLHARNRIEKRPQRRELKQFPLVIGQWHGIEEPLDPGVIHATGADDVLSRIYRDGNSVVGVYVGYYASQRTGDLIHSPKNCLPGSGWEPVSAGRLTLQVSQSRAFSVNEYVVEKGLDRDLVLYWYQGRGRVIASEYAGKAWLLADALTLDRTDGSLVRLITPVMTGERDARMRAASFARDFYPMLRDFIPE